MFSLEVWNNFEKVTDWQKVDLICQWMFSYDLKDYETTAILFSKVLYKL